MRFAYVTKTLINEFWQDVAAGIKSEAGKYKIKFDAQAGKDESSLVEQLNLAQTILSQKPTALLLSPQSDSNLVPAIQTAKKNNIPTVVIDDREPKAPTVTLEPTRSRSGPRRRNSSTSSTRTVEKSPKLKVRRAPQCAGTH